MNRLHTLLVVYYPHYATAAVEALQRMLRPLQLPGELIIVNNVGAGWPGIDGVRMVAGDNQWREFSGWQAGITQLRAEGLLAEGDGLVLCNDTLCHHNRFGPLTRHMFRRAIRQTTTVATPMAIGERWGFDAGFTIDGYHAREWLSTWLVMLNPAAVQLLQPLAPVDLQQGASLDDYFAQLSVDSLLSLHISRWLGLAEGGNARWYAAFDRSATAQSKPEAQAAAGKGLSILLEKRLSAQLHTAGTLLVDVFASQLVKQLRRLESRPRRGH